MRFPFGQDIIYTFFPIVGNEPAINVLDPQTPSIWVFPDTHIPSRSDALSGNGHTGSEITSWTAVENNSGFKFTIPAITDPDVNSNIEYRTYWLGINFRLQTSIQVQTVIRALELYRVTGHHAQFLVTAADCIQLFPQIESYYSADQINSIFRTVKLEIINYLTNKGFDWSLIWDPDSLKEAAKFKVLMHMMAGQRKSSGDSWDKNFDEYKSSYTNTISALKLKIDAQGTKAPTAETKGGGYAFVMR